MHRISSRYRVPRGRSSKRKIAGSTNIKKRCYNSSTVKENISVCQHEMSTVEDSNVVPSDPQPSTSGTQAILNGLSASASERKLSSFRSIISETDDSSSNGYMLVNHNVWSQLFKGVPCAECGNYSMAVQINDSCTYGYTTKLKVQCKNCSFCFGETYSSSRVSQTRMFDSNKRMVEAFLSIGKGHAAMEKFSIALGINVIDKRTFANCLLRLCEEGKAVKNEILRLARSVVREAYCDITRVAENTILDIGVSYDGSWQKRGHTSNIGLGLIIDTVTGLVIDYEILSKYCAECTAAKRDLKSDSPEYSIWLDGHQNSGLCEKNFNGTSNAMEVQAAEHLWKRSLDCGFRYISMVSDGDAKTFSHLEKLDLYGSNYKLKKEECLNHVAKRLVKGLENKVSEWRAKGVTLGGKKCGSLKKDTILKLSNFYRKAIKDNAPDVSKMKQAIYATLHHCMSTDANPQHNKCPRHEQTWCFYNKAIIRGEKPKAHSDMKTQLTPFVVAKIMPVYQRLASDELLTRCTGATTQNCNESMHSLIWGKCSKNVFVGKKRLELAVISSIGEFNMGCLATAAVCGQNKLDNIARTICVKRDERRLTQSRCRSDTSYKTAKKISKKIKLIADKQKGQKEGKTYSAGQF